MSWGEDRGVPRRACRCGRGGTLLAEAGLRVRPGLHQMSIGTIMTTVVTG